MKNYENKKIEPSRKKIRKSLEINPHNQGSDIIDGLMDPVAVIDLKGKILQVNQAFLEISGYSGNELEGKNSSLIAAPEDRERYLRALSRCLKNECIRNLEISAAGKNGKRTPVLINARILPYGSGKPERIIASFRDITELKSAEEAIWRNNETLLAFINSVTESAYLIDLNGIILFCNEVFAKRFGMTPETMIHTSVWGYFSPEVAEHRKQKAQEVIENKKGSQFEDTRMGRVIENSIKPVFDVGGNVISLAFFGNDITERKRAEEVLLRYELLAKSARDIILFMRNKDYRILEANDAAVKAYGYSREELLNLTIKDIRADNTIDLVVRQMTQASEQGILFETTHRRKDGTTFPVEVSSIGATIGGTQTLISLIRDITDRKKGEEALQSLQASLFQAEKLAHVGAWWIEVSNQDDINSNPLFWSEEVYHIFGYEKDAVEVTNELFFKHTHPDDRRKVGDAVAKAFADKDSYSVEHRIIRADGKERIVQEHADFRMDENGRIKRINGAVQDITERKLSEQVIIESEYRYRSLFENMINGYANCKVLFDESGKAVDFIYLEVNKAFEKLTGLHDVVGKKVSEVIPAVRETNPELFEIYGRCASNGVSERFESYLEPLGIWLNISVFCPERGYFTALFENITERKAAENELRAERERWKQVVQGIADEVWICDTDGKMSLVNLPAVTQMGLAQFREKRIEQVMEDLEIFNQDGSPRKPENSPLLLSLKGEIVMGEEYVRNPSTGVVRWRHYNSAPIRDASGRIQGSVAVVRDITDLKHTEEELKKAMEELKRSNQELEQFAYVASHDLQEPLRMISSYTKLLGDRYKGKLDQDADEFIYYASDGAIRMQKLINDLLTYSRVSTKQNAVVKNDCNSIIEQVKANLAMLLEETHAVVTADKLPDVYFDTSQLTQLFQNLIGNAVKFHGKDEPKVHISAELKDRNFIFSVKDNGIGIDPKYFDRIFVIFQRLHTREEYEGTGMGLAICKKIVEHSGGKIWIKSSPGKGSTFYFSIPQKTEAVYG